MGMFKDKDHMKIRLQKAIAELDELRPCCVFGLGDSKDPKILKARELWNEILIEASTYAALLGL